MYSRVGRVRVAGVVLLLVGGGSGNEADEEGRAEKSREAHRDTLYRRGVGVGEGQGQVSQSRRRKASQEVLQLAALSKG